MGIAPRRARAADAVSVRPTANADFPVSWCAAIIPIEVTYGIFV